VNRAAPAGARSRVARPSSALHDGRVRAPTSELTPEQHEVLADVAEQGVHLVHVPGDGPGGPSYSYTVGLWESFEQPEVVVFGMPEDVAQDLLEALADDASEGKRFQAGERHEGLLVGYPVRLFALPADFAAARLSLLAWAYEGAAVPVVQLVWPDKQGRWPWEPDVRDGFAEAQPVPGRVAP
jgi:hypothetical protein